MPILICRVWAAFRQGDVHKLVGKVRGGARVKAFQRREVAGAGGCGARLLTLQCRPRSGKGRGSFTPVLAFYDVGSAGMGRESQSAAHTHELARVLSPLEPARARMVGTNPGKPCPSGTAHLAAECRAGDVSENILRCIGRGLRANHLVGRHYCREGGGG